VKKQNFSTWQGTGGGRHRPPSGTVAALPVPPSTAVTGPAVEAAAAAPHDGHAVFSHAPSSSHHRSPGKVAEERSPIYAYLKKPSLLDFPGHVAAVLFTSGCNMRCGFCHNASLLGRRKPGLTWERLAEVCGEFRHHWAGGAVLSGGEPTLEPELPRLLASLGQHGFAVKLDTNGTNPEALAAALPRVQYVAMDFKCRLERYAAFTGFGDLAAIARSVALLKEGRVAYEFRTTVVDGVHDADEIRAMGELARGAARFVLQPFLPREDLPDPALRTVKRTHREQLEALAAILRDYVACVEIRGA